jgi:hypothetical protein
VFRAFRSPKINIQPKAALFSAIVAAFLIESYKTLNSNSGDLTVQLLTQISQQLAASANGSTFMVSPSTPFTPAATSLACNALWFLSLGFSLACALIATLVQQWAREFLHKAEMRSAPGVRARAFSYLYYGMKRFHMHTMVEVIPLLLHASLLVFFGGLIAFLIPVNLVMVKIVAIVLCIVAVVYLTLTLLPLECLDCPYRTPVSGAFWSILQLWKRFRYQHHHQATDVDVESGAETSSKTDETGSDSHSSMDETMVEAMFRTAWQPSAERSQRDHNALLWTLKSLSNDVELEPFVEAIPDVLWGPNNPRYTYAHHIGRLAQNPDVQLPSRIVSLLASCDAGILSPDVNIHRQITCFKGLWAIASLSTFDQSSEGSSCSVDFSDIIQHPAFSLRRSKAARLARPVQPNHGHHYHGHYHRPYIYMASPMDGLECYASTMALMLWSTFTAVKRDLDAIRDYIATKQRGVGAFNPESDPKVSSMYHTLESKILELKSDAAQNLTTKQTVEELVALMPFRILFEYLSNSASLAIAPYRWKETRAAISVDASVCSPVVQQELEDCLGTMINPQLMNHTVLDSDEIPWIDSAISQLLSLWHPENAEQIPRPIITILEKWPKKRLRDVLWEGGRVGTYLWSIFATILSSPDVREEDCATFWHLASAGFTVDRDDDKRLMHLESILAALSALPFVNWSNLIIPLIRIQIFEEVSHTRADATGEDLLSLFNDPRFPHDTAVQLPHDFLTMDPQQRKATYRDFMKHRVRETRIAILAELLEYCTSDVLPYHTAVEIISQWIPRSAIHPIHQVRLASSVHFRGWASHKGDGQNHSRGLLGTMCKGSAERRGGKNTSRRT